jgi:hypothetical protein
MLLDVLAVVALAVRQAEQPLLQDRVPVVPKGQAQTAAQVLVGKPGQAILAPTVGLAAGVVVRQVIPGVAARAVILAHGAPLPVADVGAPPPPASAGTNGEQALTFRRLKYGSRVTHGASVIVRILINSPSDQAWNGQPPG